MYAPETERTSLAEPQVDDASKTRVHDEADAILDDKFVDEDDDW